MNWSGLRCLVSRDLPSMASYLSWLLGTNTQPAQATPPPVSTEAPEIEIVGPTESEDRYSEDGYDTDRPPAFPALNSPQRSAESSRPSKKTATVGLMGPPPPRLQVGTASSSARQQTTANSLAPLTTTKVVKKSRKVALAPGHSTLDWANLKGSGADLRVCLFHLRRRNLSPDHAVPRVA
jgi:hypothetical protein